MNSTLKFQQSVKTIIILFSFFAFSQSTFAQGSKPHYVINNAVDAKDLANYYDILKDFDFDEYRFYDKRRTIKFVKSNVTVDLYSAKELLDIYQKPISPLTIMDNVAKTTVSFLLYAGKVQIITVK